MVNERIADELRPVPALAPAPRFEGRYRPRAAIRLAIFQALILAWRSLWKSLWKSEQGVQRRGWPQNPVNPHVCQGSLG
jgi:hypothetical protein